jgi:alkanesulfonate monooxygenase SsuD/methylene tetrahydromethanopterin reductase-like flavin-dependent oxidoreductase (luciferase family)
MPIENRLDILQYVAVRADALGYEGFGLPETWSYDTAVLLSAIAQQTKQIKLTSGIWGVWGRSAATIAMAAATLNMVSNGRFQLGLGASTPQLTEGWHERPFDKPYTQLRQTVLQVRALLNGERVSLQGETEERPLALNLPPQPDLPIYIAATSPKSIRLAGEIADGWFPYLVARDKLPEHIDLMQAGAEAAGVTKTLTVSGAIPVSVAPDRATARQGAAWIIAFYIVLMGDVYRNALIRQGFGDEVQAVLEANKGRRPSIVPPEAERLLEQLTIYGTPNEIAEQFDAWYEAGMTLPIVMLNPNLEKDHVDLILQAAKGGK